MALPETLAERVAALKAPVENEGPVGPDLSYDPGFETVKGEIDKLTSIAGERPDWSRIVEVSEGLLREKSKDLRLAIWWAAGKVQRDGLDGFVTALFFLKELCGEYWETMHPPLRRARARGNMTSWLADQVEEPVRAMSLSASDREAMELANQLYNDLDELWSEQLGDAYGGMGGMRGVLRDKVRELPAEPSAEPEPQAAEEAAAAAPAAVSAPAAAAPAAAAPSVSSAADVGNALTVVANTLRDAAYELRRADPANGYAYRLHRLALWLEVRMLPPAEDGMTRIPPPSADVRSSLDSLVAAENWREVLETVETESLDYIFWLDLQRFAALAMDRLGALFIDARETVGREVVAMLQWFPQLATLKFSDGTPFADAATATWLEEEQAKFGGGSGGGGNAAAAAASEEDRELAERFESAKEMVMSGKVADGLGLAVALAARGADARTRFRSRLSAARLAVQGGKPEIARPMLEALLKEIEAHALEDWEPALCASTYVSMLACVRPADENEAEAAKYAALFEKLSRIDPAAAIKAAG